MTPDVAPCHSTKAADRLLDAYAIEVATCCGKRFEDHDETVTDHVVRSRRIWNAHLHDLIDSIEAQAKAGSAANRATDIAGLEPAAPIVRDPA